MWYKKYGSKSIVIRCFASNYMVILLLGIVLNSPPSHFEKNVI